MKNIYLFTHFLILFSLLFFGCSSTTDEKDDEESEIHTFVPKIKDAKVSGYTFAPRNPIKGTYGGGYSMYSAVWPFQRSGYLGIKSQSGLFGTWMHPQVDDSLPVDKFYTDIEGGVGWHRGDRFMKETPKFNIGAVQLNFAGWANGPGAGGPKTRDWDNPRGKYGVAQLSPWLLWPPDGLNFEKGTCGQLVGRGYLPLPLTEPKSTTAGKDISTGNQCWTLFLNTANFKGPVAFITPYFWSKASVDDPRLEGMFLDQRPSRDNKAVQMETQYIYAFTSSDSKGERYGRMAPTQYPIDDAGNSVFIHQMMVYNKKALWDGVYAWFKGGSPVDGKINAQEGEMEEFKGKIFSSWTLKGDAIQDDGIKLNIASYMIPNVSDLSTFSIHWDSDLITIRKTDNGNSLITLPQYYHLIKDESSGIVISMEAVSPEDVPDETGLKRISSISSDEKQFNSSAYVTPEDEKSCWKTPGPAAGPFYAKLGDGSTLTYYWYRFADQPALLNADMTKDEREEMQRRVELLHKYWNKDKEYLSPPLIGKLANIDSALIVTPPAGMEIGYVPIVTRQSL